MRQFKDIPALHSVLCAVYKDQPGPGGRELFAAALQQHMQFTPEQARGYSAGVLTRNSNGSADFVNMNAYKLVGTWSRGDSAGSAGNLIVNRTESWIFSEDLTYEIRHESYQGYVSPFGGGFASPRSSSRFGIWAPSDVPSSPFSLVTIDDNGVCRSHSVEWSDPGQTMPQGMSLDGKRFGRMD